MRSRRGNPQVSDPSGHPTSPQPSGPEAAQGPNRPAFVGKDRQGESCERGICAPSRFGGLRLCQLVFVVFFILMAWAAAHGQVLEKNPKIAQKIQIIEHLGDKLPLDLPVIDAKGDTTLLSSYFGGKRPVILNFHYSNCPMLCGVILDGMVKVFNQMPYTPGKQYHVISISIDPKEVPAVTEANQERYTGMLEDQKHTADAWRFFTAPQATIDSLTAAIGFKYYYVPKLNQYMHAAAIYVLGTDGKISRYFYGIQFKPNDVKLAVVQAGKGEVGSTVDRLILYCCRYDPNAGGYSLVASKVMTVGGVITLIVLGLFLGILFVRDRAKKHAG